MNLIIDIGNNSAKFFLFNGEQIVLHARRKEEYNTLLQEWSKLYEIEKSIVSTVKNLSGEEVAAIEATCNNVVWFSNQTPMPLEIKYSTPHTLGCDRLAAAVGAAAELPGRNILVIDAGSAITIDFVDKEGNFRGGNISPGVNMRLKALHMLTARLPLVSKEGATPMIGEDTETAIRSGVIRGIGHEIDGYINEFRENYGDVFVFLTGGDEKILINRIKNRIFADKFLVAKGLNKILAYHDIK